MHISNKFDAIGLERESSTSPVRASKAERKRSGIDEAIAANNNATNIMLENIPSKSKKLKNDGNLPENNISQAETNNKHHTDILITPQNIFFQASFLISLSTLSDMFV